METIRRPNEVIVNLFVPHEDVIRTVLFLSIIPQLYLSSRLNDLILWHLYLIGSKRIRTTNLIDMAVWVAIVMLSYNVVLSFILTVASSNGSRRVSHYFWYGLIVLILFEFFIIFAYSSYNGSLLYNDLKKNLLTIFNERENITHFDSMGFLEQLVKCCGVYGPKDYNNDSIPDSCCSDWNSTPCMIMACPRIGQWHYSEGCINKFYEILKALTPVLHSTIFPLAIYHVILLIAAFWYKVMMKNNFMDMLLNKRLIEEFPPQVEPQELPMEPSANTYYCAKLNKDHYRQLIIQGVSPGRYIQSFKFDKMRNASARLRILKKQLNLP